ncbi:hypothetical protein AB0J63_26880 [Streptosporangium canum]|uniref:hypothetical protein n=1 Tax=Streptosporangium canum TaxID=324952 RepID=UPI00342C4B6F
MAEEAVTIGTVLTKALQMANIGDPPYELVRAMRAPVGKQQLVVTYIHGHKVKTVINPLGMWRPDREAAVWKCLVKLVQDHAA